MNVYDRVVPNNAGGPPCGVLAAGCPSAVGFRIVARTLARYLLDVAGKKVDLLLASSCSPGARHAHGSSPSSAGSVRKQFARVRGVRDFSLPRR